jgi:hypothetical protein
MTSRILFILLTIIVQVAAQDIRTIRLLIVAGMKYQCASAACSSPTIISSLSLRDCQIACLSNDTCQTVTFDQTSGQCVLFSDVASRRGNMSVQIEVLTMIVTDGRSLPTCK